MLITVNSGNANNNNNNANQQDRQLLQMVANAAVTEPYRWEDLQGQIRYTLISIVSNVDTEGIVRRNNDDYHRCLSTVDRLQQPPFTIQRICELLLMDSAENQQYTRIADYLRAMATLLSVETSCSDPALTGRR